MKAEGVGLVGSVLIMIGIVVTTGADEMCRSEVSGCGPCKSTAEEPQLTGTVVEDDVTAAKGDCAGSVVGAAVEAAAVDGRPGNMASPGVEDLCGVGRADGA